MFRCSLFVRASPKHAKQQGGQKLNWYQQQKQNAGYWWAEKKKEAFFAFVAIFALGQVAYKEFFWSARVQKEKIDSRVTPPPVNIRRSTKRDE